MQAIYISVLLYIWHLIFFCQSLGLQSFCNWLEIFSRLSTILCSRLLPSNEEERGRVIQCTSKYLSVKSSTKLYSAYLQLDTFFAYRKIQGTFFTDYVQFCCNKPAHLISCLLVSSKLLSKWTKWIDIHLCTLHELQPVIHWVPLTTLTMSNLFNKNVFFISSTRCSRTF